MKFKYSYLVIAVFVLAIVYGIVTRVTRYSSSENANKIESTSAIDINEYKDEIDAITKQIKSDLSGDFGEVKTAYGEKNGRVIINVALIDKELCLYAKKLYDSGEGEDETWQQMKYKLQDYSLDMYESAKNDGIPLGKLIIKLFNNISYDEYVDSSGKSDYSILTIENGEVKTDMVFDYIPTGPADAGGASNVEVTAGMKNALRSAENYLSVTSFSRKGLINQLEYEKYSEMEAEYAVDNCGANWYDEAERKANSYLSIMSFSYDRLVEQLEFDGFTSDEARYGAEKAYK